MPTKIKLKDGSIRYAVHGILGSSAAKIFTDSQPGKKLRHKIKLCGDEMFRTFRTSAEGEAYKLGVIDMSGHLDYTFSEIEKHFKTFGSNGAIVLQDDGAPNLPAEDPEEIGSIAAIMTYHLTELIQTNPRGIYHAMMEIIPEAAMQFYTQYAHITEWAEFLNTPSPEQYTSYDEFVAEFGKNYFESFLKQPKGQRG